MKKHLQYSLSASLILLNLLSLKTQAQDVSDLIKSGPADATKLAQAYFMPAFKGFGFGMNSAWYNSAKAKNLGRFDIRIQATGAFVPTSDQSFDIRTLGLSENTKLRNPSTDFMAPTAFGEDKEGAEIVLYAKDNNNNPIEVNSFKMPQGSGFNIVPSPQVQLTVGIIKNTDVSIRFTPKIGKQDNTGTLQVLGFGVKHEITKLLFPGKTEKIIPVDISLAFGYNQLTYDYKIPIDKQLNENPATANQDLNQRIEAKLSGYTFDAILSKKLAIFTPFVSIGYNSAKTKLGLLGDYNTQTGYNFVGNVPTTPKYSTITDPVKINQKDISGLRGNVGFALHLAFFRLYGSYSIGEYQAVTAGIGLGIGK